MEKDIPFLQRVLPKKFSAAYMKGRGNYVCLSRLKRAEYSPVLDGLDDVDYFDAVRRWSRDSETGDRAELDGTPRESLLLAPHRRALRNLHGAEVRRLRRLLRHAHAPARDRRRHHHRQPPPLLRRPRASRRRVRAGHPRLLGRHLRRGAPGRGRGGRILRRAGLELSGRRHAARLADAPRHGLGPQPRADARGEPRRALRRAVLDGLRARVARRRGALPHRARHVRAQDERGRDRGHAARRRVPRARRRAQAHGDDARRDAREAARGREPPAPPPRDALQPRIHRRGRRPALRLLGRAARARDVPARLAHRRFDALAGQALRPRRDGRAHLGHARERGQLRLHQAASWPRARGGR